jgi:nucleoside-diphosphate-sugar epimerase
MKVLLLGATGTLGSRIALALLAHNHTVTVYIRSSSKLNDIFSPEVISKFTVVEGDALSQSQIKDAILAHDCDAVVNSAGLAAMAPWGKSTLPQIVDAVLGATQLAARERGQVIRLWVMAGMGLMDIPGTKMQMSQL